MLKQFPWVGFFFFLVTAYPLKQTDFMLWVSTDCMKSLMTILHTWTKNQAKVAMTDHDHSHLGYLVALLQQALCKAGLEKYSEASTDPECSGTWNSGHVHTAVPQAILVSQCHSRLSPLRVWCTRVPDKVTGPSNFEDLWPSHQIWLEGPTPNHLYQRVAFKIQKAPTFLDFQKICLFRRH